MSYIGKAAVVMVGVLATAWLFFELFTPEASTLGVTIPGTEFGVPRATTGDDIKPSGYNSAGDFQGTAEWGEITVTHPHTVPQGADAFSGAVASGSAY